MEVEGAVAEIPQNSPLDVSRIEKQMKKTGNTPFQFEEIQVCVKEGVFLPMQQLNELRRKGLEALEAKIVSQYRRSGSEEVEKEKRGREAKILDAGRSLHLQPEAATAEMYAYAEQGCQLEPIAEASWISRVYIDCNMFPGILQSAKMNEAISFLHEKGKQYFLQCLIFSEIGQESAMRKIMGSLRSSLTVCSFEIWNPFSFYESILMRRQLWRITISISLITMRRNFGKNMCQNFRHRWN